MPGTYHRPVVAPKHPHAWINVDNRRLPAIVLEWQKISDANGYQFWHARCLYWLNGQPAVTLVPQMRVEKA